MYRTRNPQYGLVAVYAEDGTLSEEVKEPDLMFGKTINAITKMIPGLAKKTFEAVAAALKEVVGEDATVKTAPAAI